MIDIEDFNFEGLEECLNDDSLLVPVSNRMEEEFKKRTFEEGKNSDGKIRLGGNNKAGSKPYTKSYQKRKDARLKSPPGFVNLLFSGDMEGNISQTRGENFVDVKFLDSDEADKFQYNEDRYGIIRNLTEDENELAVELYNELLVNCITDEGFKRNS